MTPEEKSLADAVGGFAFDPLGYVLFNFPWGEAGTDLAAHAGPRKWQAQEFAALGQHLRNPATRHTPYRSAIAAGHSIGKSAWISMLIHWAFDTCPNTRGIVTANTDTQLRTKTWAELAKWHRLGVAKGMSNLTATALMSAQAEHEKTWRIDAVPWSIHNTEGFAGLQNQGARILIVFDEGSAIPQAIWDVATGATLSLGTEVIWVVFGNPTRVDGPFRECFGSQSHRWHTRQIDARTVEGLNLTEINKLVADHGEDSDLVRVRVRGQFPRASSRSLIGSDVVAEAQRRPVPDIMPDEPCVVGIDVARFGSDFTVFKGRRGNDGRSIPAEKHSGLDTMQTAARAADYCRRVGADAVTVDETGVGAGALDRLRQLLSIPVHGVNNGARPDRLTVDGELVHNKGAELWAAGRSWLKEGGCIEATPGLQREIETREYSYDLNNKIVLEPKDIMVKRGLASPDEADALFLTFAYPVPRRFNALGGSRSGSEEREAYTPPGQR